MYRPDLTGLDHIVLTDLMFDCALITLHLCLVLFRDCIRCTEEDIIRLRISENPVGYLSAAQVNKTDFYKSLVNG